MEFGKAKKKARMDIKIGALTVSNGVLHFLNVNELDTLEDASVLASNIGRNTTCEFGEVGGSVTTPKTTFLQVSQKAMSIKSSKGSSSQCRSEMHRS